MTLAPSMDENEQREFVGEILASVPSEEDFRSYLVIARATAWQEHVRPEMPYKAALEALVDIASKQFWIWELLRVLRHEFPDSSYFAEAFAKVDSRQRFRRAIVTVQNQELPVGVGVFVTDDVILTSTTTLESALGRPLQDTPAETEIEIDVEVTYVDAPRRLRAVCDRTHWRADRDLAILRLGEAFEHEAPKIRLDTLANGELIAFCVATGVVRIDLVDLENGSLRSKLATAPTAIVLMDHDYAIVGVMPAGANSAAIHSNLIAEALSPQPAVVEPLAQRLGARFKKNHEIARVLALADISDTEIPFSGSDPEQTWKTIIAYTWREGSLDRLLRAVENDAPAESSAVRLNVLPVQFERSADDYRTDEIRYPLLSEWTSFPVVRWLFAPRRDRVRTAWKVLFGALMVMNIAILFLSHCSGAACIEPQIVYTPLPKEPRSFIYGYLGELPHGMWTLMGMPLLFYLSAKFVERATTFLRRASQGPGNKLLIVVDAKNRCAPTQSVLEFYARSNKRVFRFGKWIIIATAAALVISTEYQSWNKPVFGWVQGRQVEQIRFKTLADLPGVAVLPIERDVCPDDRRNCFVQDIHGGVENDYQRRWFIPFVFGALFSQIVSVTIALYTAVKIMHFVWILVRSVRNRRTTPGVRHRASSRHYRLRCQLNFADPEERMGLARLDEAFIAALQVAVLGGVYFCLVALSNDAKGSRFFLEGPLFIFDYYGHGIGFLVNFAVLTAVCGVPFLYLDWLCYEERQHHEDRLEKQYRNIELTPDQTHEVHLAARQRGRPKSVPVLVTGALAFAFVIALPAFLAMNSQWGPVAAIRDGLTRTVPGALCSLLPRDRRD